MIGSDILRGYNDLIVLGLLSEKDSYGYNLLQEIAARSGRSYQMKETTLYSVLSRLEKNGMVRSYEGSETQGRKRTYALTDTGLERYQEEIARLRSCLADAAQAEQEELPCGILSTS